MPTRGDDSSTHTAGDQVLSQVAACLAGQARREACVGRYGGEEFAVVLPETGLQGALVVAERIRAAVEAMEPEAEGRRFVITISAGVAQWQKSWHSVEDMIRGADENLYAAKDAGRNRVVG
ncbi:MAG: hypothetical protein CL910_11575 [Deltaproteobacteria bacterium]|nr:hypothetical protein [Deltaproteobacteria bacterium]